ncbi:hypothetical protein WA026_021697 [Henosepilachna vigintioctopunctata]|uniref:HTH psq-type domain-containing protein n=1 Tax=Henosepilachna vigintioctopunctata TaxID=420089 RepID=A0AAW1U5X9_9CUCU
MLEKYPTNERHRLYFSNILLLLRRLALNTKTTLLQHNIGNGFSFQKNMVRVCKRKTSQQAWSDENMEKALNAIWQNHSNAKKAAQEYEVPLTTLRRRTHSQAAAQKKLGCFVAAPKMTRTKYE